MERRTRNEKRKSKRTGPRCPSTSSFFVLRSSFESRRGFTLMELLVVITIMVILTAAMIPVMSVASDARRLREAARTVSTTLASAQSRAISSGRSVGVLFQPMKNNSYASMEMYLVENPPPYSGDDFGYTAKISAGPNPQVFSVEIQGTLNPSPPPPFNPPTYAGMPVYDSSTKIPQRLIRNGDLIRFNYRGDLFVINDPSPTTLPPDYYITSNKFLATPLYQGGVFPIATSGVPFQIIRQPVKTSDPPVQLSDGTAVDWYFSGVDLEPLQPLPTPPASIPTPVGDHYPLRHSIFGALGTINNKSTPATPGPAFVPGPASNPPSVNTCGALIVTFNSAGTLDQTYYSCSFPANLDSSTHTYIPFNYQVVPASAVYLLIGKIEKIQPSGPVQGDAANLPNYQDSDARWVTVTRQSGLPTTAEVARLQPSFTNNPPGSAPSFVTGGQYPINYPEWAGVINAVMNSRRYASGNQSSGGI
jgi:prepilin-type N-terminal cleavage/methylation domain-containing protein